MRHNVAIWTIRQSDSERPEYVDICDGCQPSFLRGDGEAYAYCGGDAIAKYQRRGDAVAWLACPECIQFDVDEDGEIVEEEEKKPEGWDRPLSS